MQETRSFVYGTYAETHLVYSDIETRDSQGRLAQFRQFLSRHLSTDRSLRVLDFGCGDGTLLGVAEELGYENLVGVDLSEGMIGLAKTRTSADLHVISGLDFLVSQPAASFGAIIAFDVFEHLTRDELLKTLRVIATSLSPGGQLLIHVPNGGSPFYGRIRWGDITHELAFTKSSLCQLMRPLGFKEIEAYEDAPVARGLKSAIRKMIWASVRLPALLWLAAETGSARNHILTQNMFVTAVRDR